MFKRLIVLLFLLLVVSLYLSSVTATNELEYNETDVEWATNDDKSVYVALSDKLGDSADDKEVVDTNITLSLQQGEHVEILFHQFKLPDNQSHHFHINDNSILCNGFYGGGEGHYHIRLNYIGDNAINVGMNTVTVEYLGYPSTVEKINSNSIQFKTNDLKITKQSKYYSYKFNLNITKKQEKTIHFLNKNISYYFYEFQYIFYKLYEVGEFLDVQFILSKNEKIYYNDKLEYSHVWDSDNNYYSFDLSRPYLLEDIWLSPGFYNLTLVNYDGTNDTCLLEIKKAPWDILFEYEVINDTVKFKFHSNSFIDYGIIKSGNYSDYNMTIKLGNITKSISRKYIEFCREFDDKVNVLFDDLDDGVYDVFIEIPGNDYIEYFSYVAQIEIRNKTSILDVNSSNDIVEYNSNDISEYNDTAINLINITQGFEGNSSGLSLHNSSDNNSSFHGDGKDDFNDDVINGFGGFELTDSIHAADNAKSYEISKKPRPKLKDDLLSKLGITILSCMSFMVGYVRFEKH